MANFQVIGQFESLGGEAMKAQIAAPSSGVSASERLVAPVQKDFLQQGPETISHDDVKSQVRGVTFDYAQHAANMQAPADQVAGGEAMVKNAHENFEKAAVNEANANREEMRAKLVENAMQSSLRHPTTPWLKNSWGCSVRIYLRARILTKSRIWNDKASLIARPTRCWNSVIVKICAMTTAI